MEPTYDRSVSNTDWQGAIPFDGSPAPEPARPLVAANHWRAEFPGMFDDDAQLADDGQPIAPPYDGPLADDGQPVYVPDDDQYASWDGDPGLW